MQKLLLSTIATFGGLWFAFWIIAYLARSRTFLDLPALLLGLTSVTIGLFGLALATFALDRLRALPKLQPRGFEPIVKTPEESKKESPHP